MLNGPKSHLGPFAAQELDELGHSMPPACSPVSGRCCGTLIGQHVIAADSPHGGHTHVQLSRDLSPQEPLLAKLDR